MKKFTKQLVAVAMAVTVFFSQTGVTAMANSAAGTTFKPSGIEILSVEEFTEEAVEETTVVATSEEVVEETTAVETTEEVVEETTVEETTEEVVEETTAIATTEEVVEETTVEETTEEVVEETTVEETTEEVVEETTEEADVFPGLPEGTKLSTAQVADKKELAGYVSDIKSYMSGKDYVEGEILVEAPTKADAEVYAQAYGGVLAEYNENRGIARITLPEGATVEQAVSASANVAEGNEKVLPAAWPNYLAYTDEVVAEKAAPASAISGYSDTYLDEQWHHEYMGAEYAWLEGYTGAGVKVAVIDTGILKTHEDLVKNTQDGKEFVSSYGNTDNNDYQGHGTHVAGIIAADGNNGKGGSGVAPDATVRSYRVFGETGGASIYDLINAVDAAVADGNDIINMSLGGPGYYAPYHTSIKDAVNSGVAVFVAAGNERNNSTDVYPANFKEACTIGALNLSGGAATFTNFGSHVDLAFPGVDIYSTINLTAERNDPYTNVPANWTLPYYYKDGTSMATPAAAGAAAVILSANPKALQGKTGKAKVDALVKLMQSSAKKSSSSGMGKGTTYIPTACGLSAGEKTPNAPTFDQKPGVYTGYTYFTVGIDAEAGNTIYYSLDGKSPSYKNGVAVNAQLYTDRIRLDQYSKVTLKAIAVNKSGKVSKVSTAVYTFKPYPEDVEITSKANTYTLMVGKTMQLNAKPIPANSIFQKMKWSVEPENQGVTVNSSGLVKADKNAVPGKYTVYAYVLDENGNIFEESFNGDYEIEVVEKPEATTIKQEQKTIQYTITGKEIYPHQISFDTYLEVRNKNSDILFYDFIWKSSNQNVINDYCTVVGPGTAKVTGIIQDGTNRKVTFTVKITQEVCGITVSGATKVAKGKSITLTSTILPATASNKKLDWTVTPADQGVTVKNGKVTASSKATPGVYTIQAMAKDGSGVVSNSYSVNVIAGAISKIEIPKTATIFTIKGNTNAPTTYQINPVITGTTGFDSSLVSYTSSAPGIATVSQSGLVTAKAVGKTKITVAATDGSKKKATITINVNLPMSGLKIAPKGGATMYVGKGKSIDYGTLVYGEYGNPTNKNVTWSVADESIAKVNKNGKVTGCAYGTTTLYAKASDGSGVVASYQIEVIRPASYFSIDMSDWYLYDILAFNTNSDIINKTAAYKVEISGNGCSVANQWTNAIQLTYSKAGTYTVKVTLLDGSKKSAKVTFAIW